MTFVDSIQARVDEEPQGWIYYGTMGLITVIFIALWAFEGYYIVTAWFPDLYDEITPINGVMAGAYMTLMLACALAALYRPRQMIGPSKVLIIGGSILGFTLPLAFAVEDPIVTIALLVVVFILLAIIINVHPGDDTVLPASRGEPDYLLLGLTLLIAVPFLWLAIDFQWSQITLNDMIADRWFYGGYSMYLLAIVALSVVTTFDASTRRFTGAVVIYLTGLFGLVSLIYPDAIHSYGFLAGTAMLLWCLAVGLVLWQDEILTGIESYTVSEE